MMTRIAFPLIVALSLWPRAAQADPLAEVKAQLLKLAGTAPIKARLSAQVWSKRGDGADAEAESGQAGVQVEIGAHGLRLAYGADLLSRMTAEQDLRDKDPKARTATRASVDAIDVDTAQDMLHAAPQLLRLLRRATLKNEQPDTLNGQAARKLVFELGPATMSERERKYVNKTDGALELWLAPDGTPLAHKSRFNVSGRAFVVISFEVRDESDVTYAVVGDRLIATRRESRSSGSGAGERGESRRVITATVL